jgi:hypothetical protein
MGVVKALCEPSTILQLLAVTINHKPQACGLGKGLGVRPSTPTTSPTAAS